MRPDETALWLMTLRAFLNSGVTLAEAVRLANENYQRLAAEAEAAERERDEASGSLAVVVTRINDSRRV